MKQIPGAVAAVLILLSIGSEVRGLSGPDKAGEIVAIGDREAAVRQLKAFGGLIGEWRGVGQPQRGSNRGAWTGKLAVAWQFEPSVVMALSSSDGKLFRALTISAGRAATNEPQLNILLPDGKGVDCELITSESATSKWVFRSADQEPNGQLQYRCTIRLLSEIRATVLLEQRSGQASVFRRIAEVGYTRAGERLAQEGSNERQCIVTGGRGTMTVTFQGNTYYVCCDGCRQAFDADPQGVIEAWRKRIQEEQQDSAD
ncbi:MAG: hypothetical protein R3C20_12285 [Planctomycetaceae bacterium]